MRIINVGSMPRFWWINPWATARALHDAVGALKAYADRSDDLIDLQASTTENLRGEVFELRERLADLNEQILSGNAITPDAQSHE